MKRGFSTIVLAIILAVEVVFTVYMLPSSSLISNDTSGSKRRITMSEFDTAAGNIISSVLSDIYEIPKAYVLPLTDEPMPVPDESGYSVVTDSDIETWNNTDVLRYEDETVCVTLWKEYINTDSCRSVVSYAEIKIAHPTQIKHHMAGWEYCDTMKKATAQAKEVNAVVALSGDFYNFRRNGIVVQNGQLYRNSPTSSMPDMLFVNSDGDFIIEYCAEEFDTEKFLQENNIMFSMSFGPGMIVDGKVITAEDMAGYKGEGGVRNRNPRAAVGQIGPLHYLFCTVDGRSDISNGITVVELAGVMAEKGCVQAYNLDGGGSATMVFQNKAYNAPSLGSQRSIADIIYIATALPDSE